MFQRQTDTVGYRFPSPFQSALHKDYFFCKTLLHELHSLPSFLPLTSHFFTYIRLVRSVLSSILPISIFLWHPAFHHVPSPTWLRGLHNHPLLQIPFWDPHFLSTLKNWCSNGKYSECLRGGKDNPMHLVKCNVHDYAVTKGEDVFKAAISRYRLCTHTHIHMNHQKKNLLLSQTQCYMFHILHLKNETKLNNSSLEKASRRLATAASSPDM